MRHLAILGVAALFACAAWLCIRPDAPPGGGERREGAKQEAPIASTATTTSEAPPDAHSSSDEEDAAVDQGNGSSGAASESEEDVLARAQTLIDRLCASLQGGDEAARLDILKRLGALALDWLVVAELVLHEADQTTDTALKVALILALDDVSHASVRSALTEWALSRRPVEVRIAALRALMMRSGFGFDYLLKPSDQDIERLARIAAGETENEELRFQVLRALKGSADDEGVVSLLLPLLWGKETPRRIRNAAREALGSRPAPIVTQTLLQMAEQSEDPDTVRGSLYALAYNASDARVPSLYLRFLASDRDEVVRNCAADLLGQLAKDDSSEGLDVRAQAMESLRVALKSDSSVHVRTTVAFWFGDYPDPMAFLALKDAAQSDGSSEVRSTALDALARRGRDAPEEKTTIREFIEQRSRMETDPAVVTAAKDALERLEKPGRVRPR